MNARHLILICAIPVIFLLISCGSYYPGIMPTPLPGPGLVEAAEALHARAAEMEAQATRQAEATRVAQDAAARATADALSAAATAQALTMEATRAAWAFSSTATAAAIQSRATAQAATATAIVQDAALRVEQTAQAVTAYNIEATRQAVERQAQRERSTQAIKTFGPWILLLLGIVLLIIIGYQTLPVLLARLRVIRRRADEGEPLVMLERERSERIALPLRSFWHIFDCNEIPPVPPIGLQDRAAGRQQLANVMQALAETHGKSQTVRLTALPRSAQFPPGLIRIADPDQVRPWIEDVETQLLEEVNQ